jgi:predicted O-methyltransferase YrrM
MSDPTPMGSAEWEHQEVCRYIRMQSPCGVYVEIGGHLGGSLAMFGGIMRPPGLLVCVEKKVRPELTEAGDSLRKIGYDVTIIEGESNQSQMAVWEALKGHKADVLFIDGSHQLQDVVCDAREYVKMLRPGGLMIFHDCGCVPSPERPFRPHVQRYLNAGFAVWRDMAFGRRHMLIGEWAGYGLVWK